LLLLKTISKQASNRDFFLPFVPFYTIAAMGFVAIARVRRARLPGFPELTIGLAAAVSAMLGNVLLYVAISMTAASALPIIHGFSIMVVCTGSVLFFGERFSWPKAVGTLLGLASITLLARA
jgi:drug/metabolite transporter (DMT)-like permease